MADTGGRTDPFSDIISLVAGPIAAVIRSFDQLRKGADELMKGLENFNRTMSNLNDTVERVNGLLGEFEEPVRAVIPQVVRTVRFADEFASKLSGPVDQVVPGLVKLSETLNSPIISSLPTDLSGFVDAINDLVRRLSPLGQLAESAGGLFGIRIPGFSRPSPAPVATTAPLPAETTPAKKAPAKHAATKKATAKKAPARKTPAKTTPAKKATAK
jgi:hypothetical protein